MEPLQFEFIVDGPPISSQARNRRALKEWIERVRSAARLQWPSGMRPVTGHVFVKMVYYYERDSIDVDNCIKPILDALQGIAYLDDRQVSDARPAKRDLDGAFKVRYMSMILAQGFSTGREFVHVRVERAPDPEGII